MGSGVGCPSSFQSAPPARGATIVAIFVPVYDHKVSIRAPRAGGDDDRHVVPGTEGVSIRAPRAGGDRIGTL